MARVRIHTTRGRAATTTSRARIRSIRGMSGATGDARVHIRQISGRSSTSGLSVTGSNGPSEPLHRVQFTVSAGRPVTSLTITHLPGSFGGSFPIDTVGVDDPAAGIFTREFTIPFVDMNPGTIQLGIVAQTDTGDLTGTFTHDVYAPIERIKTAAGTWVARAPAMLVVVPDPPDERLRLGTGRLGVNRLG